MSSTWQDLRTLRALGQRPRLALIVTTSFVRCAEQSERGHMVIVHGAGEKLPVELLVGLEVECWLENCAQASAVAALIRERGIQLKAFRVQCYCDRHLTPIWPHNCEMQSSELEAWDRALAARAAA